MEIHVNLSKLCSDALEATARRVKAEIVNAAVIPKNEGTLEDSHHVIHPEERRAEIVADTPYARRLYMHPEYNFRTGPKAKNQNAKGQWFEDWEPGGKRAGRAAQIFQEEFNKRNGGK